MVKIFLNSYFIIQNLISKFMNAQRDLYKHDPINKFPS